MTFYSKYYFGLISLLLTCCNNPKATRDYALLQGHWLTTKPGSVPSIFIDDKHYFMLLQENNSGEIDSFPLGYELKDDTLTILQGSYEISTNRILSLTNDSLVYIRDADSTMFHFSRKK